ncbi:peroxidase [Ranunculus cassubicifolius]
MAKTQGGLIVLCVLTLFSAALAQLKLGFYNKSCPKAEQIVLNYVRKQIPNSPGLAASLLRLQYTDCFVRGCDASILLNSTPNNKAEKDSPPNFALKGFEFIDGVKKLLEAECPGTVSCADIIALVARDSIVATGGPSWNVSTGRRDGTISNSSEALASLPPPNENIFSLENRWLRKGLTIKDLVVLSGAHTIGVAHCSSIANRLYNFTGNGDVDPDLDTEYATFLRGKCKTPTDTTTLLEMDPGSSKKFDLSYYKLLGERRGLFQSDGELIVDFDSRVFVTELLQGTESNFFMEFGKSMENMGQMDVKTGSAGQIRRHCARVNA